MFTVTPLHLEIVMHYHTRGDDMVNLDAPAVKDYVKDLLLTGMLEDTSREAGTLQSYRTTERGKVWLDYLLKVPFPVPSWRVEQCGDEQP